MTDPRYPIGKFQRPETVKKEQRLDFIRQIAEAPKHLREAVRGLTDQQLDTPYRDGGWTVRQVVHHVCDSHMNAFLRFKLALTEDEPLVKTYREDLWAQLSDAKDAPVDPSLQFVESLHVRWGILLRSMGENDFLRTFRHPEHGVMKLESLLALYAWHGRHHVAHITSLRSRLGWK